RTGRVCPILISNAFAEAVSAWYGFKPCATSLSAYAEQHDPFFMMDARFFKKPGASLQPMAKRWA
ncbi:hypothetical protein, partial [Salmonella enterica]|uniref:hypothetical protein n=1 Tax=Salmonella enterica TaxID=28901 RepID=UPI0020A3671D